MWLTVTNTHAAVSRATDDELRWLDHFLSFSDLAARYKAASKEKVSLLNPISASFPAGLVPLVMRKAPFKIEQLDRRAGFTQPDPVADLAWLRDYQRDAVQAALGKRRGIISLPTGGGKTDIAVGLVRAVPCRWLLMVHRAGLVHQAADRWAARTGEPVGRIAGGEWTEARFTCATLQTMYAARDTARGRALLGSVGGLIVDEAHCLPAATYLATAQSCTAHYRIGLSATPLSREDQRSILAIATLGPIIHKLAPQVLIDAGVLAMPHIRLVLCDQTAEKLPPDDAWDEFDGAFPADKEKYNEAYERLMIQSETRNKLLVRLARGAKKPALLFVKSIEHGKDLTARLLSRGISAEFMWGAKNVEVRRAAVKRLEHGDAQVIVCSVVFQEGVDIPSLETVIVGSGGKSTIAALQRLGRGMRSDQGRKGHFTVLDIKDVGCKWLERHSRARTKAYAEQGYETTLVDQRQLTLEVRDEGWAPSFVTQKK